MKKLFEFEIVKEEMVKETVDSQNEQGEKIQISKDVKKGVPHKFFIKKPTRGLFDEAELFYAVKLSEGIRAGLLTRALLAKRYENDGGPLSESEIKKFGDLYAEYFEKSEKIQELESKKDKTAQDNTEIENLKSDQEDDRLNLQKFEMNQSSLYDQTAEVRARNKTILWWILNLAYLVNDKSEDRPVFKGTSFEEKLNDYDENLESEDPFKGNVIQKFTYFISYWYVGKTVTTEDFKRIAKDLSGEVEVKVKAETEAEIKPVV